MTQADRVLSTPPTNTSATPVDPLYRRTDISPEDFFQTLGRVRRSARDEIERLIKWLDSTIDCDQDSAVDDEPCDGDTDTEPSLGSFDSMSNQIKAWQTRHVAADIDAEIDRCDDEPTWLAIAKRIGPRATVTAAKAMAAPTTRSRLLEARTASTKHIPGEATRRIWSGTIRRRSRCSAGATRKPPGAVIRASWGGIRTSSHFPAGETGKNPRSHREPAGIRGYRDTVC
jgi:hypothetical protein